VVNRKETGGSALLDRLYVGPKNTSAPSFVKHIFGTRRIISVGGDKGDTREVRMKGFHRIGQILTLISFQFLISGFGAQKVTVTTEFGSSREKLEQKLLKLQPPRGAIELEKTRSFPENDKPEEQLLWMPQAMAFDSAGSVYVLEYNANCVVKYDPSGKFIKKFGRSGQGPGDISKPVDLKIVRNTIMIAEAGNRRYQFFDLDGNSMKSVKILRSAFSYDLDENGNICQAMMIFKNQKYSIEILSPDGNLINSFGTPFEYKWDEEIMNDSLLFIDKEGEIITLFCFLPIVRRYSAKGTLLGEYRLETDMFKIKEKFNKESNSKRPSGGPAFYYPIVHCADFLDDRIYILTYVPPRIWIWEIDKRGNIFKTYWAFIESEFIWSDILVKKDDRRMNFYILQRGPEAKVCVFAPKK
jgi:hypothetical protein